MDNTVGSLTEVQKSVIIGCLLGDGYLRQLKGRRNAFLEVNHSYKQKDYVDWKYEKLKNLVISPPKSRKYNNRIAYRFFTKAHFELTELLHLFYKDGKKRIPEFDLDPLILAVWFMDDGSMVRASDVYLNTQQFSETDQLRLIKKLSLVGISARLNKDKQYQRIRLLKSSINVLEKLIQPYLINSMKYKVGYDPVETCSFSKRTDSFLASVKKL